MANTITKKQIGSLKDKVLASGIVPIDKLVATYEHARVELLNKYQPPYTDAVRNRFIANQSVISYLNLLILISKTKAGRRALEQAGITLIVSNETSEQLKKAIGN